MAETDNPWKQALDELFHWYKMEEQDRYAQVRLIDWMLVLPRERNRLLLERFNDRRKENPMPFVSVFDEYILEQKQKLQDQQRLLQEQQRLLQEQQQELRDQQRQLREISLRGIELGLKLKFKEQGQALFAEVQKQTDPEWLGRFLDSIEPAGSIEELARLLP